MLKYTPQDMVFRSDSKDALRKKIESQVEEFLKKNKITKVEIGESGLDQFGFSLKKSKAQPEVKNSSKFSIKKRPDLGGSKDEREARKSYAKTIPAPMSRKHY